jgi:hypothetical protein
VLARLALGMVVVFGVLSILATSGSGTTTYTVGGTVSGLAGAGLALQNNGGDDLAISGDGAFTFAAALANGSAYNVTVSSQPTNPAQTCGVTNASGTLNGANVTTVSVNCPPAPTLSIDFGLKQLLFAWTASGGATHYKLFENPDGVSGFTQIGGDLTTTSMALDIAVHRHNWANARYLVEACDAFGCTASNEVTTSAGMLEAIGYVKASNTGAADQFSGGLPGLTLVLSADGNTLAVGAPREDSAATGINGDQTDNSAPDAGAVYLFTRDGATWSQQAYVKASNTEAGDAFGLSIALSADGNTLAVGAYAEDSAATGIDGDQTDNSAESAGAVYIFTRSGATWSQQAYVKASSAERLDTFGRAVALSADGQTLAVGSCGGSAGGCRGAVEVYTRSGTTWSEQALIQPLSLVSEDRFGSPIVLSADGNTLAAAAVFDDSFNTGFGFAEGAVYVYTRSGATWTQQAFIKAPIGKDPDLFGEALALSADGNTLAVGAPDEGSAATGINGNETDNSIGGAGAVHVFTRSGTTWSRQAYVKASNTPLSDPGGHFGWALALSADGNMLAVGAYAEDSAATGIDGDQTDNSADAAGAVYLFTHSGTTWSQQAYVKASNTEAVDLFGASVALSGDGNTLAVGAYFEDSAATGIDGDQTDNSADAAGAVYLY